MPARKSQFQTWYEQVKRELLVTEPQNILARSECCQNIINECISHMNGNLGLPALKASESYTCRVEPKKHLKFLLEWPGLRVDNSPKAPKTKKEYEKKSKNWLNGRRAPNYGKTLFPFFIRDAERYILQIAKALVKDDDEKQKLYYDIVIYKVLAQLCGCSVSLHEQAKKAPFFCKNSVERKGRLKEILQGYASDHEYIQGFPSCFEEAIGYFDRKSNVYFQEYRCKYLGYNDEFDDENDSLMDSEDIPSRSHSNRRSIKKMKRSPSSSRSNLYFHKKERLQSNRQRASGADAEYWKKQFMNLKQEFVVEQEKRLKAETERDNLKNLIDATGTNNNHSPSSGSNHYGSCIPGTNGLNLSLANNDSFGSSTTASTTTLSVCNDSSNNNLVMINNGNGMPPMPCLRTAQSFQSQQSGHSCSSGHCSHHSSSMNTMNTVNGINNLEYPHNNTFQINHMNANHHGFSSNMCNNYGPAMPPIVNNCTNNNYLNNGNGFNQLSLNNNSFILPHTVNNQNQTTATCQPIQSSILPTTVSSANNNNINTNNHNNTNNLGQVQLFQGSANDTTNFGMPATDTISSIIDTMPMMNVQQKSEDSYAIFGDHNHNNHNHLSSPLPVYSFQ